MPGWSAVLRSSPSPTGGCCRRAPLSTTPSPATSGARYGWPRRRTSPTTTTPPCTWSPDASSRSVGADPACFRANLVVSALGAAGFVEDAWVGRDLAVGAVRLRVTGTTERCVMVGAATLRTVSARNALRLGVYADVLETGVVRAGDAVVLG
jgi:hypothetical protein